MVREAPGRWPDHVREEPGSDAWAAAAPGGEIVRRLGDLVRDSLAWARVVVIAGPRQCGKTTLARQVCGSLGGEFVSLDDPESLARAIADPAGFISRPGLLVIDEFQRAGDPLLLAVKRAVDSDRRPGRYLLTGSTRFLTVANLSESLAGRVDIVELRGLSLGERTGGADSFLARLAKGPAGFRGFRPGRITRRGVLDLVCEGGFPEPMRLPAARRGRWYASYLDTVLGRDVTDIADLRRPAAARRLLRLLAARTAQELNISSISRDLGVPRSTVDEHIALLEAVYLTETFPAWSSNLSKKVVQHGKTHFVDAGLAAHLVGADAAALDDPAHPATGALVETFVAGELVKQRAWTTPAPDLFHFRDRDGWEVDIVVEHADGGISVIEVKSALTVWPKDARHIERMRDKLGKRFRMGVILHPGREVVPHGDRISVMPISALWA